MAAQTEKQIENDILDYLTTVTGAFMWKNQNIGVFDPRAKVFRKNHSKHQMKGISDILGVINGKMVAIEVKKPTTEIAAKTYPTRAQKDFLAKVRANGGYGCVARSIEDVEEFLLLMVGNDDKEESS